MNLQSRFAAIWTASLLILGLCIVFLTFRDYGITWDEAIHARYGQLVYRYFASGFQDDSCNRLYLMRYYGPLFDLLGTVAGDSFPARHLLTAFAGLFTIAAVASYAWLLRSRVAVVAATFALAFNPVFYGHSFFNPKDIPFACAFAWLAFFLCKWIMSESLSLRRAAATGVALGLTLALRPGGLPLVSLLIIVSFIVYFWQVRIPESSVKQVGKGVALMALLGWVIMVAPWPWALGSPIVRPIETILVSFEFPFKFPVLFAGQHVTSRSLPRTYLIHSLLITTPLPVVALALAGLARTVHGFKRIPLAESCPLVIAAIWVLLPVLLFSVMRPNVYDGTRHFLFLLPGIAILAGAGADWILRSLRSKAMRWVGLAFLVIFLLLPIRQMWKLHPYEYTYFNELTGGVGGAAGRYETDYWISSYKEAAEWINAQRKLGAFAGPHMNVLVAGDEYCAPAFRTFLDDPNTSTGLILDLGQTGCVPHPYDYYVSTTRYGLDKNYPDAPVVHTIGREGATFCVIKRCTGM